MFSGAGFGRCFRLTRGWKQVWTHLWRRRTIEIRFTFRCVSLPLWAAVLSLPPPPFSLSRRSKWVRIFHNSSTNITTHTVQVVLICTVTVAGSRAISLVRETKHPPPTHAHAPVRSFVGLSCKHVLDAPCGPGLAYSSLPCPGNRARRFLTSRGVEHVGDIMLPSAYTCPHAICHRIHARFSYREYDCGSPSSDQGRTKTLCFVRDRSFSFREATVSYDNEQRAGVRGWGYHASHLSLVMMAISSRYRVEHALQL